MTTSRLISFEQAYASLTDFDCIVDVRSPAEFAEDHIPGAINCPVLNNEERIQVGTLYKQVSPFEAKKVGAALVAKNIGNHIEQNFLDKPKDWKPLLYCWRGGNRSGSMTHIMAKIGWHAMQLDGGYKGFDASSINNCQAWQQQRTGSYFAEKQALEKVAYCSA